MIINGKGINRKKENFGFREETKDLVEDTKDPTSGVWTGFIREMDISKTEWEKVIQLYGIFRQLVVIERSDVCVRTWVSYTPL